MDQYLGPGIIRDHEVITHQTESIERLQYDILGYKGWEQATRIELSITSDPSTPSK